MKELSIFNQLRPVTVGFDSVFDNFERMFSDDFFSTPSSYPAYNIVKTKDNHYDVVSRITWRGAEKIVGKHSLEVIKHTVKSYSYRS